MEFWITIDNERLYYVYPEPIMVKMEKFANSIVRNYEFWEYKLQSYKGYCCFFGLNGAVMRNSNDTLYRNDRCDWPDDSKMCGKCRGKGHPWNAEIWNGSPKEHMRSKGPLLCDECNGSGYL